MTYELPELPPAILLQTFYDGHETRSEPRYTEEQMRAYATEAVAAERADFDRRLALQTASWEREIELDVAAERGRLRVLVEAVRDANDAAQGEDVFRLLMPRQERAWRALMDSLMTPNV